MAGRVVGSDVEGEEKIAGGASIVARRNAQFVVVRRRPIAVWNITTNITTSSSSPSSCLLVPTQATAPEKTAISGGPTVLASTGHAYFHSSRAASQGTCWLSGHAARLAALGGSCRRHILRFRQWKVSMVLRDLTPMTLTCQSPASYGHDLFTCKQVSAVANRPARRNRAVDRAC